MTEPVPEYPICHCDLTTLPAFCRCLNLTISSPQMAAVVRGESHPETSRRTRSQWIAGWLRIQRPTVPLTPSRVLTAAGSVVSTAIGRHRVDAAERDRRREICEACPTDQLRDGRCQACSCVVAAKSLDRRQFCPHGYW